MIVVMFRTFMGEAVPAFAQLLFSKEARDRLLPKLMNGEIEV